MPFRYAEFLAYASLLIGLLKVAVPNWGVLNVATTPPELRAGIFSGLAGSLVLVLILIYYGRRGKTVARYILAGLYLIGIIVLPKNLGPEFRAGAISGTLVVIQAVIQAIAIVILVWPKPDTATELR